MKLCVLIPARYNSSRIPRKPLFKIKNQSMILRTIKKIKKVIDEKDIYVISDNLKVSNEVKSENIKFILSKKKSLNGTERCSHAFNKIKKNYDFYLIISCDNPFINTSLVKFLIKKIKNKNYAYTVHKKINNNKDVNNRSVAKIVVAKNENILFLSRSKIPTFIKNNSNKVFFSHHGIVALPSHMIKIYKDLNNTPYQVAEDNEWLKLIENGHVIKSFLFHKINSEINTYKDLKIYLGNG